MSEKIKQQIDKANLKVHYKKYVNYSGLNNNDIYYLNVIYTSIALLVGPIESRIYLDDQILIDLIYQIFNYFETKITFTTEVVLGICHMEGYGTEINLKRAEQILKVASNSGNSAVYTYLSILYNKLKQYELAFAFALKSHNKRNACGTWLVGEYYYFGLGTQTDTKKGLKFARKSIARGCPNGQYILGLHNLNKNNYKRAYVHFVKGTKHNYSECYYYLGKMFEEGLGRVKNKIKAKQKYQKAFNNVNAHLRLAEIMKVDDKSNSLIWHLKKAADLGNIDAIMATGIFFISQNNEIASHYFVKAAEKGRKDALVFLVHIHTKNNEYEEALKYCKILEKSDGKLDLSNGKYKIGDKMIEYSIDLPHTIEKLENKINEIVMQDIVKGTYVMNI